MEVNDYTTSTQGEGRCPRCGEGVNFDRFVERGGERLCLACADEEAAYFKPLT